jgi:hypothetical protein
MRKTILTVLALFLFGCGTASQSPFDSSPSSPAVTVSTPVTVSGVAATGAAVSGTIYLKDATGRELSVTTTDGKFAFDVSGLTPPYMLKASWNGNSMYSFAASAGTANITPITQMIVAAAANGTNLDAVYTSPDTTGFSTIAANLPAAVASTRDSLKPLLTSYSADMDPITGVFSANGSGMDGLLDHVNVSSVSGVVSITDKNTGSTLFSASAAPGLNNSVSAMSWTNTMAAIANDPDVKASDSGDALAVWWQYAGTGNSSSVIKAQWLNSEASPTQVSSANGFAMMPKVAVDPAGNAIVAWLESNSSYQLTNVWVNRYSVSKGWGTPVKLTNTVSNASGPSGTLSIAMDSAGNAVLAWNRSDETIPSHFDIYAAFYSVGSDSWSAPTMISNGTNCAYVSKVVANDAGKMAAIYTQFRRTDGIGGNGDASDIWVATGTTKGGFSAYAKVSSSSNLLYGQASVAMDPAGDILTAWIQNNDSGYFDVWVSRKTSGGAWETPVTVANSVIGECYFPEVAFDSRGNSFVTWQQQLDAEGRQYVAVSQCPVGGTWSTRKEVSENIGSTFDQHLVADPSGNVTLVWYQIESTAVTVRSTQYLKKSGWGTSKVISTLPSTYDGYMTFPVPRVATNSSGKSFIIWGTSSM